MLIEEVIFFSYDLDYGWISLILISRIYIYITSWLVLNYFSYWDSDISVTLRMDMSMTLRSWVDYIFCPDYSINASRLLLILKIMIYLKNLTDSTWHLPDNNIVHVTITARKILYTVTTPSCYACYMSCYTGILFIDTIYPVISVSWLHMLTSLSWLSPSCPSNLTCTLNNLDKLVTWY